MNEEIVQLYADWMADIPAYCRSALKIQDKQDKLRFLELNPVQMALHEACEAIKHETGFLYAIVLKARRMGVSTYVAARFFAHAHLASPDNPVRGYVLCQDDKLAKKLLRMYSLMWEQHEPVLRIARTRSNDHEMVLENGSAFEVNTASTPSGGRGGGVTRFHGSEVAYWDHAEEHAAGSMQQVSRLPGAEMILESTANGASGSFYERWRSAELGRNRFKPLFYPWTMMPDYVEAVPAGFSLSRERPNDVIPSEAEYAEVYGVSMGQMAWRRGTIEEFGADGSDGALVFAREYPVTADEAFLSASGLTFIAPAVVEAARLRPTAVVGADMAYPLVMGLDPAPQHGEASSALVWRRGKICYRIERIRGLDPVSLAMRVYREFMDSEAERLYVDEGEGGGGHTVVTHLQGLAGSAGRVVGVRFGNRAQDPSLYANVRAEIWSRMAKWLQDGGAIPDERPVPGQATLASELLLPQLKHGGEKRVQLEAKHEVSKRLGSHAASPDGADALATTFFYPDPGRNDRGWIAGGLYSEGRDMAASLPSFRGEVVVAGGLEDFD